MKKINIIAMLIILLVPIVSCAMEEKNEPIKTELVSDEIPVTHWDNFADEIRLSILSFVLKTNDAIAAINAKDDKAIRAIFNQYLILRFTSKKIGNLVLDKQLFNLDEIIKCFMRVYPKYLSEILMNAAKSGCSTILELAFESGLSIHRIPNGILDIATRSRHIEFCEKLILAGIFEGVVNTRLVHAIYLHKSKVVACIVKDGQATALLPNYNTELMMAVDSRNIDTVKLLLNTSNINAKNNNDETALMISARWGDNGIVQLLLENGAVVDAKNNKGETALMIAVGKQNLEVVELLINRGASLDLVDKEGGTVLLRAVDIGNLKLVELLIHKGASVDFADQSGFTALMGAAEIGNKEIVKLLLDNRANINLENHRHDTALSIASNRGHVDVVELFQEYLVK